MLKQVAETNKTYKAEQKVKGLEIETRYDIKDVKQEKRAHMN